MVNHCSLFIERHAAMLEYSKSEASAMSASIYVSLQYSIGPSGSGT